MTDTTIRLAGDLTTPMKAHDNGDGTFSLDVHTNFTAPTLSVVGALAITDGGDVAEGATTDAAATTDTSSTISAKLRGLVKWAYERMPASLGQKTKALSFPVVLASDQYAITAVAFTSPPTNLTAGANTALTFASAVKVIYIENNTTEDKTYTVPSPATAGSKVVAGNGGSITLPVPSGTTTLGIYGVSASALNGTAGSNLIVEGWA